MFSKTHISDQQGIKITEPILDDFFKRIFDGKVSENHQLWMPEKCHY